MDSLSISMSERTFEIRESPIKSSQSEEESEASCLIQFSEPEDVNQEKYSVFKNFVQKPSYEKQAILRLLEGMKFPPAKISSAFQLYRIETEDTNTIVSDITNIIVTRDENLTEKFLDTPRSRTSSVFSRGAYGKVRLDIPELVLSIRPSFDNEYIGNPNIEAGIECMICFESEMNNPYTLSCSHKFCFECLKDFLIDRIKNGRIEDLPCPQNTCPSKITIEELKILVAEEWFSKYEYFVKRKELDKDPFIRWCVRSNCGKYTKGRKGQEKITCECGQEMCFKCSMPWHDGKSCDQNTDEFFQEYTKNVKVRNCPKCQSRIEKIDGCNHMTCSRCHYQFCWNCLKKYSRKHYSAHNWLGCPGMMFGDYDRGPSFCKKFGILLCHILYVIIFIPLAIIVALAFSLFGPIFAYIEYECRIRGRKRRRRGQSKENGCLKCLRILFLGIFVTVVGLALSPITFTLLIVPGSCIFYFKRLNN